MKNITRTFTTTKATVKLYDEINDNVSTIEADADGKLTEAQFKAYLAKTMCNYIVLKISDLETFEELRGIPEDVFIANGTAYSERDKNTRGMISKTVSTNCYVLKVWNENSDSMEEKTVTAGTVKAAKKQLASNYKLLKVMGESKVESLICMSIDDFKHYSRPMIDHFHYKD